jgi:multidrug transporter EmrE-like cation transporter
MRPFLMILISVILGVTGQLCFKTGMRGFEGHYLIIFLHILKTPVIILGLGCYFISTLIWLNILSKVNLSYAYPMLSMGYVLIVFLSWLIFKENVSLWRWSGVFLICLGVSLLSR